MLEEVASPAAAIQLWTYTAGHSVCCRAHSCNSFQQKSMLCTSKRARLLACSYVTGSTSCCIHSDRYPHTFPRHVMPVYVAMNQRSRGAPYCMKSSKTVINIPYHQLHGRYLTRSYNSRGPRGSPHCKEPTTSMLRYSVGHHGQFGSTYMP